MLSGLIRRFALETLASTAGAAAGDLSLPMLFGLGAGLSFEYVQRPHESPSRFIVGFNQNIERNLASRVGSLQSSNRRRVFVEALRENALVFNLDRSPTTGVMGMEMLAEQLTDFDAIADSRTCLEGMDQEIALTGGLYRRVYAEFLREIGNEMETALFCQAMSDIAQEWDEFAGQLDRAVADSSQLERSARALRRLAFREEHFWGMILEESKRMYPGER